MGSHASPAMTNSTLKLLSQNTSFLELFVLGIFRTNEKSNTDGLTWESLPAVQSPNIAYLEMNTP